ncbi:MAG: hypothetical protein R8L58_05830 [Mariprofundaceae bacterium]
MHVEGDSVVKDFLEESVHFQNEEVMTLYLIIFSILGAICAIQYQLAKRKTPPESHHIKHEGQL